MIEYKMEIPLKKEDFDETGKIRASSLLFFFQEAAARHADLLGVGFDYMIQKGRIWIITKLRFRVERPMDPKGSYYVKTCPRQKKSRVCPRDYYIYSQDGTLMVTGTTLWSVMDHESRKLERVDFEYEGVLSETAPFADGFPRFHMKEPESAGSYTITEADLDVNDHTNNCRYADLVCSTSKIRDITELSIQFSKDTRLGDRIQLFREAVPGGELICGSKSRGEKAWEGDDPRENEDEKKPGGAAGSGSLVFLAKVCGEA